VEGLPQGSEFAFKGPLPRRMTAEQFTDAVWQLTATAPAKPDAEVVRAETPADALVEPTSRWIWSNDLAASPPGERLAFRRTATLPSAPTHAMAVLTADNAADLFLNGGKVLAAEEWTKPTLAVVTPNLRPGENTIVATATNGAAGGPAALRVEICIRLADGSAMTIATDGEWEWTATLPDGNGTFPKDLQPAAWARAAVVTSQHTWAAADAPFASQLAIAASPTPLPMVRAVLMKATPLMASLGRPNRDQVVTSRPSDLTTLEAIQLANEQSLADEFDRGGATILAAHGPTADAIAEWIFTAALARRPTAAELDVARGLLGDAPTRETIADCLWSVVMLPEFQLVR
jgi:hypothetical protein